MKNNIIKDPSIDNQQSQDETPSPESGLPEVTDDIQYYKVTNAINIFLDGINKNKYKMRDGSSMLEQEDVKKTFLRIFK